MKSTELTVTGMSCHHCIKGVQDALAEVSGVKSVEVDLPSGTVTIAHSDSTDINAIKAAINEEGYEVIAG